MSIGQGSIVPELSSSAWRGPFEPARTAGRSAGDSYAADRPARGVAAALRTNGRDPGSKGAGPPPKRSRGRGGKPFEYQLGSRKPSRSPATRMPKDRIDSSDRRATKARTCATTDRAIAHSPTRKEAASRGGNQTRRRTARPTNKGSARGPSSSRTVSSAPRCGAGSRAVHQEWSTELVQAAKASSSRTPPRARRRGIRGRVRATPAAQFSDTGLPAYDADPLCPVRDVSSSRSTAAHRNAAREERSIPGAAMSQHKVGGFSALAPEASSSAALRSRVARAGSDCPS